MRRAAARSATHPTLEGLDLLDGAFYAGDPHEAWTWMRREAPVYYDCLLYTSPSPRDS